MHAKFFCTIAKKTTQHITEQPETKQIINDGFKKNLAWMKQRIEEMNSKANSYTTLDAKEFGEAMEKTEKLVSFYYR